MPLKPHGDTGAYVGGDWVPIEDLAEKFMCKSTKTSGPNHGQCGGNCAACPRSRSKNSAAHPDGSYDIVVVGAGGIGCAIARELSKTSAKVLILEAADDVTQGATKGNSGIIHAGYDDKPGSIRAKFCPTGCRMFPALDQELHFGYQKNTSLVIAKTPEDDKTLKRLLEQGGVNGVKNLRIINQKELREREPAIHPDATGALLAEDAGNIIPYEFCIALAENAVDNGVELRIRRKVEQIEKAEGGGFLVKAQHWEPAEYKGGKGGSGGGGIIGAAKIFVAGLVAAAISYTATENVIAAALAFMLACTTIWINNKSGQIKNSIPKEGSTGTVNFQPSPSTTQGGASTLEVIKTKFVVNAAGCFSDEVAAMVGDKSFQVNQRYGEYVLLHKNEGKRLSVSSTIFPCPGPMGKGVLVQNTLWGNLILGPTARDTLKKDEKTGKLVPNVEMQQEKPDSIVRSIMAKCRDMVPSFDAKQVIHTFCGARAKTTRGDWVIEQCATAPNMIHAAGIDSPGLAASPAIALEVVRLLKAAGAPVMKPNPTFNPNRAPIIIPKKGMKDAFGNGIKMGPQGTVKDPKANVVCKCEKVTEAEIVEALHRSLPVDSTQAIRKRTRAGMGHCQGDPDNYCCEDRVAAIIARETGVSIQEVGRRPWPGSSFMPRRFFKDEDKAWVDKLSQQ